MVPAGNWFTRGSRGISYATIEISALFSPVGQVGAREVLHLVFVNLLDLFRATRISVDQLSCRCRRSNKRRCWMLLQFLRFRGIFASRFLHRFFFSGRHVSDHTSKQISIRILHATLQGHCESCDLHARNLVALL